MTGGSERALPLLDEAQQRFEGIARERASKAADGMASVCVGALADCLRNLGRLDEAATAYEEAIRRDEQRGAERDVAVGKGQLGTVRKDQRRFQEALEAYDDAREWFTRLDEPGSVAVAWHQTGMVYQEVGKPEAAEDAYQKSLAINVRLGNAVGQAMTLEHLGMLYDDQLGRTEEAVSFFRQAIDKYIERGDVANEGTARSNLAIRLRKLRRLDEARQEIHRAINYAAQFGHASAPWKTWSILAGIETDAGNPSAAAEAKRKAMECYLAYRRDGGENHEGPGRLAFHVTQSLLAGDPATAASLLQQVAADPTLPALLRSFIQALQAIVAGRRDRTLADAPNLNYSMAAEILFLLDELEKAGE
jgi:Tfp pilus assembly protein PilF